MLPPPRPRRTPRALLRPLLALLGAAAVVSTSLVPLAAPASAREPVPKASGDYYLCTGYVGCANAGYDHFGYRERGGSMYWRMYAGHNCTNYVAYRMIQAGMSTARPWDGSGNATNWGYAMSRITDQTPAVGAVAWWKANVPGAGSAGHVAVVQQVVSPTEIIVSEDSWGGDFHWRRITTSGSWPSGFIHFVDARKALSSTAPPVVKGVARVGQTLVATKGSWSATPDRARRQWLVDGTPVAGATTRSFTLRPRHVGHVVSARVTARKAGYEPGTATATGAATVWRGRFAAEPPVVQGEARVGEELRAVTGPVTPDPARSTVQWYADGDPVAGATGPDLTLTASLRGARIRAGVTHERRGFRTARRLSGPTEPVAAPQIEVTSPAVLEGTPVVGEEVTAVPGGFAPRRARASYTWLRDGRRIRTPRTPSYLLRPRDAGHRVAVRVDLERSGWARTSQVVALPGTVRSPGSLAVRSEGRRGRAVVRATLTAPGVRSPSGPAVVTVGRRSVEAQVTDGRLRAVVRGLRAGTRRVVVRFRGTEVVLPVRVEGSVRVLRRRALAPLAPVDEAPRTTAPSETGSPAPSPSPSAPDPEPVPDPGATADAPSVPPSVSPSVSVSRTAE